MEMDGQPVTGVTLVGQVRTVNPQTTNITYRIDDGTGVIDVKKWVDAEKQDDTDLKFAPDTYVRVFGRLNTFNGRLHVSAHSMRAIDDFNEVNYHLLEAVYSHLYFIKKSTGGADVGSGGGGHGGGGDGDEMFVDGGYGAGAGGAVGKVAALGLGKNAHTIVKFLSNTADRTDGMHIQMISEGTGLSIQELQAASDSLLSNGLVYTTRDDETWAVVDY